MRLSRDRRGKTSADLRDPPSQRFAITGDSGSSLSVLIFPSSRPARGLFIAFSGTARGFRIKRVPFVSKFVQARARSIKTADQFLFDRIKKPAAGVLKFFVRAIVAGGLQQFRLLFHRQRQESFAKTSLGFLRQPLDSLAISFLLVAVFDF